MTNPDPGSTTTSGTGGDASPERTADLYDASYYEAYGPLDGSGQRLAPPYRRGEDHWHEFFNTMAQSIVELLQPRTALDAGCAIGFLVEELRVRGVDARGVDISEWAIDQVPSPLRTHCWVAPLTEEFDRHYDLIICTEVLEHLTGHEAEMAVSNICRHTDMVLFSSTPDDFAEPTHVNVQPSDYWIRLFAAHGFFRNLHHDASYVAPHAVLLQHQSWTAVDVAEAYERGWWQADRAAQGARAARHLLAQELEQATMERGRLANELIGASSYVEAVNADRDRLDSLLVTERAFFETSLARASQAAEVSRRELDALKQTRLFRHTSTLRRIYTAIRRLIGRRPTPRAEGTPGTVEAASPPPEEPPHPSSYTEWIRQFDTLDADGVQELRSLINELTDPPLISVVLPVFDPSERHLREAIDSVITQIYPSWELCIADDASTADWIPRLLAEYEAADPRIHVVRRPTNGHISAATNSALGLASGRYVGFLDHDDTLAPSALALAALAIARSPDFELLYSDEDKIDAVGTRSAPYFKPDWDPFLLLGQNYLTHFCVVRRELLEAVGGLREGFEGAQDWDLVLRITENLRSDQIGHIPHVLYHWRLHSASTATNQSAKPYAATAARRATTEHLERTARTGLVEPLGRIGYQRIRWELPNDPPLVSIIIPTRDGPLLQRCLESLWYRTRYPRYEVILVDNGSEDPGILRYLIDRADRIRVIRDDRPFNYSALNNVAAIQARGSVLCLLNDDVEVISEDWLDEMVALLFQPHVGVVGAKLFYPDGRIQHAGAVLGIGGIAAHAFRYFDRLFFGHFGHTVLTRQSTAVTGACLVTRREVWNQIGGLDEEHLAVSYNDVDFCLRAEVEGWRTVWTPFAELIHHESVSRGADSDAANVTRAKLEYDFMEEKWRDLIRLDPAYNPNLTLNTEDYSLSWPPRIGRFEGPRRHLEGFTPMANSEMP
jgi:GT2 family glycosyltransferase